jgi:hypothetical protein
MTDEEIEILKKADEIINRYENDAFKAGYNPDNLCPWVKIGDVGSYHNDDYEDWKCQRCGEEKAFNSSRTPMREIPFCSTAKKKYIDDNQFQEWLYKFRNRY